MNKDCKNKECNHNKDGKCTYDKGCDKVPVDLSGHTVIKK